MAVLRFNFYAKLKIFASIAPPLQSPELADILGKHWEINANMKLRKSKKVSLKNTLFFLGLILNIVVVKLFAKTVISPFTILQLYLIPGLISYFIIDKFTKIELSIFIKFVYSTVSFGSLFTTLLLFINLNFKSSENFKIVETKILKKGFTTRTRQPTADAEVDGIIKGFVFRKLKNLDDYSSIQLKLREGTIGWNIIEQSKLLK
ncbi:hypothetical protein EG359_01005 [Chryseobacterium joostei]|uniref:Uncharacterized protein n=1 Tax=Chryseobacterium joostei TaxID=112234 RepID=A0A1N7IS98_9FLAO|nr:hypothetical protein [Chryseobacterium joostei]AZA98265.1 hypothetical protein EG359_01005 [Chryseobacterium joostei]SIS39907.1 hypothetical protein SAMN05421768_106328 [Chryseobacterium joostei]